MLSWIRSVKKRILEENPEWTRERSRICRYLDEIAPSLFQYLLPLYSLLADLKIVSPVNREALRHSDFLLRAMDEHFEKVKDLLDRIEEGDILYINFNISPELSLYTYYLKFKGDEHYYLFRKDGGYDRWDRHPKYDFSLARERWRPLLEIAGLNERDLPEDIEIERISPD